MENAEVAAILDSIADLLDLKEANEFRIRSYRSAARTVRDLPQRLEDMVAEDQDLAKLPSIGRGTAEKIHEILESGTCQRLEQLLAEIPSELATLMRIPQLGPRKAMQLHKELGVTTTEELAEAVRAKRVRKLAGWGPKSEEKILAGIETLSRTTGRILYHEATDHLTALGRHLDRLQSLQRWEVAGSLRRCKETIGDLDILIQAGDRQRATEEILAYEAIAETIGKGAERISVRLRSGLQVDFRFFEPETFGAAWLYFTGSKAHNITLRKEVQQRGWKLSEYGLQKGNRRLAGKTEASIYHRLNLCWVPPELREDRGEIAAAAEDDLPTLIEARQVRGDLQSHTQASDGAHTIEEIAAAAGERGYQYLAITDHSKRVTMANGLDDRRALRHAERIRKVNQKMKDFWLLAGIEVDILKSGRLDLKHETLRQLDWVIASVHYDRDMSEEAMTKRLLAAIESGRIHAIAHPFGRIIGRREPIAFDFERIARACAKHNVCLEINAQPDRLDLPDTHCKPAAELGVSFTLGTDAHKISDLDFMPLGVHVARRGWLRKGDVLNTKTAKQLRRWLEKRA